MLCLKRNKEHRGQSKPYLKRDAAFLRQKTKCRKEFLRLCINVRSVKRKQLF